MRAAERAFGRPAEFELQSAGTEAVSPRALSTDDHIVRKEPVSPWVIRHSDIKPPKDPTALSDISFLLDRLIAAFGEGQVATLIDCSLEVLVGLRAKHRQMNSTYAKRIIDTHDIFTRALQVFQPATVIMWLVGKEPFLQGRRPLDVLIREGAAPLIAALDAIDSEVYP